jgi:phage terminase large subunit-like protein
MGLAGPGRRTTKLPPSKARAHQTRANRRYSADLEDPEQHPWDKPGLTRAERVIRFVNSLPCTSGPMAGKNFQVRPWQREFIEAVYATDEHGRRLVRTAVLSMGRGGGKTTLAAALALCHLAGPEAERRGEIYSAANDRSQATRIFDELTAIALEVPWLAQRLTIRRFTKEIEDRGRTGSRYTALSADVPTKLGFSITFCVYDELGAAPGRALLDALDTAMGKRDQPLMLVISTQAARDEAPLSMLIDYGLRIQRGEIIDPSFHLTLHTAPEDADPWSPETWKKANPALGDFRSLEDVERLALRAQRMPSQEASFRNYVLNQRVDTTSQFINMSSWRACGEYALVLSGLKGRPCYAGLDLGATKDMTALVLAFACDDGEFVALPFCWLPADTLPEACDHDGMPYATWAREGYLLTCPGRSLDPKVVAMKIAELHGHYKIQALAFDRWRIEDIRRELAAIGCNVELIPFGQGFKDMAPAVDVLERLVEEGKLLHGRHPVLTMAATNAKAELDAAGNRKLSKRRSQGRIDPLVALTMAVGIAARPAPTIDVSALIG